MTIRKTGTSGDQQVNPSDDPGAGQGVRKEAVQNRGGLDDAGRRDIVRGEGTYDPDFAGEASD